MKKTKKVIWGLTSGMLSGAALGSLTAPVSVNAATAVAPKAAVAKPGAMVALDKSVKVLSNSYVYYLTNDGFERTSMWLNPNTVYQVQKANRASDGRTYYLLLENGQPVVWITEQRTVTVDTGTTTPEDGTVTEMTGVVRIQYAPGYGINLWNDYTSAREFTGRRLPHDSTWKIFKKAVLDGHTWYNLGGNQWIDADYAVIVEEGGSTTTPPITENVKPSVTYQVNKNVHLNTTNSNYYLTDNGFVNAGINLSNEAIYQVTTETVATDGKTYDLLLAGGQPVVWILASATTAVNTESTVTINFVDIDGNILQSSVVLNGKVGETWSYKVPVINGYYSSTADLTGTYTSTPGNSKVTYYKLIG